jgi:hypothetical protein
MGLGGAIFSLFAILLFDCPASKADPITFTFSGTVENVSPALGSIFSTDTTISGSYTFDSTLGSSFNNPTGGGEASYYYQDTTANLTIQIGAYTATSPDILILVENDAGTDHDQYRMIATSPSLQGPDVGGLDLNTFSLILIDPTDTVFSSTALPLTPPDMPDSVFTLFFNDVAPQSDVQGSNVVMNVVPEPSIGGLFGLALVLTLKRRSGKRLADGASSM